MEVNSIMRELKYDEALDFLLTFEFDKEYQRNVRTLKQYIEELEQQLHYYIYDSYKDLSGVD